MTNRFHWAGAAYLFLAAAEGLGVPQADVLTAAGMGAGDLPGSPGRIGWTQLAALTQAALELTGEPALGLLAGLKATIQVHGVAGAYYMHSSPLRASQLAAYNLVMPRITNLMRAWHEERGDLAFNCVGLAVPDHPLLEPHVHLYLGMHVFGLRQVFGKEIGVHHVSVRSRNIGTPEKLSALLGCEVLTGQPRDWVAVPRALLDRPLPLADPWLREQLRPQFEAFLQLLEKDMHATMAVRMVLEAQLGGGNDPELASVALALRMKTRTLQAQLAAENTSFSAVLDAVRKEFSLRLLSFPGAKLGAVAAQAGFSDAAAFTRAFKRWTGATPKEWQEERGKQEQELSLSRSAEARTG